MLTPWKECHDQPRQHIKKQRHHFVNKGPSSQGYGFSSGHVWMWELDYKESWAPKNWCFWTVVLEKTLESPLDCKEIQPVHPKGDQSWLFTGRTDVEAETPIVCPPDVKSWLIWKDPDAGKDSGQEEKGATEDEMVGWHNQLNGHGFGWTPGVGDGQGGLACCGSRGHRVGHNWVTELNWKHLPVMWQTWVRSLGWEDPVEKEMTTIPVLLPGKFHEWKSLVGYSPWDRTESDTTEQFHWSMDYTVHRILQARILEWVTGPFSRWSSQPRDRTQVTSLAGRFFTTELPGK